jgi:hypothetical protein
MSRLPSRTTRLTWVARGVLGGVRLGYTSMLTRGASPSLRYPPLAVIAAVATSFLGIQHALADGPTVTPAPGRLSGASSLVPGASTPSGALPLGTHEYHMIFDRPVSSFWHEASETWTFKGPTGKVICALPCQSWVDYPSRAYVEGSGISFGSTTRLALPDTFADTGFLVQDEHAGNTLWARPNPGKGCPDCAVALGIISGASLAVLPRTSGPEFAATRFFFVLGPRPVILSGRHTSAINAEKTDKDAPRPVDVLSVEHVDRHAVAIPIRKRAEALDVTASTRSGVRRAWLSLLAQSGARQGAFDDGFHFGAIDFLVDLLGEPIHRRPNLSQLVVDLLQLAGVREACILQEKDLVVDPVKPAVDPVEPEGHILT